MRNPDLSEEIAPKYRGVGFIMPLIINPSFKEWDCALRVNEHDLVNKGFIKIKNFLNLTLQQSLG